MDSRRKAIMFADTINEFSKYVHKHYKHKDCSKFNPDKLYQIKLLIEDFQLQPLTDELRRINQFSWHEKYTYLLVERLKKGIDVIDEYVKNNYNDLFLLSAKIYTLKNLNQSFRETPIQV